MYSRTTCLIRRWKSSFVHEFQNPLCTYGVCGMLSDLVKPALTSTVRRGSWTTLKTFRSVLTFCALDVPLKARAILFLFHRTNATVSVRGSEITR